MPDDLAAEARFLNDDRLKLQAEVRVLRATLHNLIDATEFYLAHAGRHMSERQNQELIQTLDEAKKR